MNWLRRRRQVALGLIVALSTWLVFPILLAVYPSDLGFPRVVWVTFGAIILSVTFLYFKAWLMAMRARTVTRVGVALIAENVAFGIVLQLTMAASYWPQWFRHVLFSNPFGHGLVVTVNDAILAAFALVVIWTAAELILTEDPLDLTTGEPDYADDEPRWTDAYQRETS